MRSYCTPHCQVTPMGFVFRAASQPHSCVRSSSAWLSRRTCARVRCSYRLLSKPGFAGKTAGRSVFPSLALGAARRVPGGGQAVGAPGAVGRGRCAPAPWQGACRMKPWELVQSLPFPAGGVHRLGLVGETADTCERGLCYLESPGGCFPSSEQPTNLTSAFPGPPSSSSRARLPLGEFPGSSAPPCSYDCSENRAVCVPLVLFLLTAPEVICPFHP